MDTIKSFEDNLRELLKAKPDINFPRIMAARNDLENFSTVHADLARAAQSIARPNFMEEFESAIGLAKDRSVIHLGMRMDSFLRAGIVFGDVTNKVLLQEVRGEREDDFSIARLSRKHTNQPLREWATRLDKKSLIAAHCLCVYRDKLLLHFDTPRVPVSHSSHTNMADRRLVPISFDPPADMYERLEQIAKSQPGFLAASDLKEVEPGKYNIWRLLESLFYRVPLFLGADLNPYRACIDDESVKYGGIRSPSMSDVVTGVDSFLAAVAELCLAGDWPRTDHYRTSEAHPRGRVT
jgi:hypothetical protein